MSCTCYPLLLGIFTVVLHIRGGGGECSTSQIEECQNLGKRCSNGLCDQCLDGLVAVGGECYDASYAQDIVLEHLEDCDPNVDPACRKSLEDISDQLKSELSGRSDENGMALSLEGKSKRPLAQTTEKHSPTSVSTSEHKQEEQTNIDKLLLKTEHESNRTKEDSEVENRSKGIDKKSETNFVREKHKKNGHADDDDDDEDIPDVYFLIIIIACTLSGVAGIALSGYCWYKLHNTDEKVKKSDYIPGVKKMSGRSTPSQNGDHKLDYKAEMYHYVHTKNQIAAMEKAKSDHLDSEGLSNDEEDETEDYTVYECPGLAPTGDMTVTNPLFSDQEVNASDEGRTHSNHSSPSTPVHSNRSPSR